VLSTAIIFHFDVAACREIAVFSEINLRLSAEKPLRDLTARVLKQGLDVLGIETVEQM
jgi:hypothetical protein